MSPLDKQLVPIEKILDKAWREPDEALFWHTYGFKPVDVKRLVEIGVVDPHTARALDTLGIRIGLLEHTREEIQKAATPRANDETVGCPECSGVDFRLDTSGTVDCVGCGASVERAPDGSWTVVEPEPEPAGD